MTIQALKWNSVEPPTEVRGTTRITGERVNWRRAKPTRNVFDRLSQNTEEGVRVHLDARRTSTSLKKNDVPTFSPIHDEINELRKQLDKLTAKSSKVAPSITSSPFSLEIQQTPLPTGFRMSTITMYEGKTDPQDHLDAFNDQMDLLQDCRGHGADALRSH